VTSITELVDLCDDHCAAALGWFVVLGQRVAREPDPTLQRLWAAAAHRHAWHAELWAERRPAIPQDAVHPLPEPKAPEVGDDLVGAYRHHLQMHRSFLAALRAATDPDLDPSTRRVVELVDADLADLQQRLAVTTAATMRP
jgi:hypothetical protein